MLCEEPHRGAHSATRRAPAQMVVEERCCLHALPAEPFTAVVGQSRQLGIDQPMVQLDWCVYSVA